MSSVYFFTACPKCGSPWCYEELDSGWRETFLFCYDCHYSARIPWD